MSKRKGPTPKRPWGPWFEDPRSPLPDGSLLFGNGNFTVHVELLDREAGMVGALHLSVHDQNRSTRHDWRDFQRIKTELLGPEREAVELYPAESRVVDTANEYHLWVMPEGTPWPFGFKAGKRLDPDHDPTDDELAQVAPDLGTTVPALRKQLRRAKQRKLA